MVVEGLSEACLISLLCEFRRFSNHYGIVNSIIVFAACSCDIFGFSLLYTHLNIFTTSMIMHERCFFCLFCFLKWLHVDILCVLE